MEIWRDKFHYMVHDELIRDKIEREKKDMVAEGIDQGSHEADEDRQAEPPGFLLVDAFFGCGDCQVFDDVAEKIDAEKDKANNKRAVEVYPEQHEGRTKKEQVVVPVVVLVQKVVPDY